MLPCDPHTLSPARLSPHCLHAFQGGRIGLDKSEILRSAGSKRILCTRPGVDTCASHPISIRESTEAPSSLRPPIPIPQSLPHPPPPPQFLRLHRLRRVLLPLSSSRQHPSPPGRREIADAHRPARRFRRRKIPPTLPIFPTREHSRRHDHPLRQRPGRPGGLGLLRPLPRLHLLPLLLPLPCPEPGARTPGLRGG